MHEKNVMNTGCIFL